MRGTLFKNFYAEKVFPSQMFNQSRQEPSHHRLGKGGQTSLPPINKYFHKKGFRAGFERMAYCMIAQDVIHCATRAWIKEYTEFI